jgi:hypothetical protein
MSCGASDLHETRRHTPVARFQEIFIGDGDGAR